MAAITLFDFLNSINDHKKLEWAEDIEKAYPSYMVTRGLSYFADTVKIANEMNLNSHLDSKLQYDFYFNLIPKGKRFSKWFKPEVDEDVVALKGIFNYSEREARAAKELLLIIGKLDETLQRGFTGGRK